MTPKAFTLLEYHKAHGGSAVIECLNCNTVQTVGLDEDGQPDTDFAFCHEDECQVRMCQYCERYECEVCGLNHCKEHTITVTASTSKGEYRMKVCSACFDKFKPQEKGMANAAD